MERKSDLNTEFQTDFQRLRLVSNISKLLSLILHQWVLPTPIYSFAIEIMSKCDNHFHLMVRIINTIFEV